jgi:hypothetical protein
MAKGQELSHGFVAQPICYRHKRVNLILVFSHTLLLPSSTVPDLIPIGVRVVSDQSLDIWEDLIRY